MEKLDFDNIELKQAYNIPNKDTFYIKYANKNSRKEYIVIIDKDLNILIDRNYYITLFFYIPHFDLFINASAVSKSKDKFNLIYKSYENNLLYSTEEYNNNISHYIDENINNYINYSDIILSEYRLSDIKYIKPILSKEFISIIDKLCENKNDDYIKFYKITNNSVIEFTVPNECRFSITNYKICYDFNFYYDYTYIIYDYKFRNYLIKIYPDFNEYEVINISKVIKEKYGFGVSYNDIFILFNEIIIITNLHNYRFNITELFKNEKYINYRIHKIGNTIDKEDL